MKNRPRLAKKPAINQIVRPPEPPLKAEELIDLLARPYHEAVSSMADVAHDAIAALLFCRTIMYSSEACHEMVLHQQSGDQPWATTVEGLPHMLEGFPERLHEAWGKIDSASLKVSREVDKYRKFHPKVTA